MTSLFREWMQQQKQIDLSPRDNNVVATIVMAIYFKLVIETLARIRIVASKNGEGSGGTSGSTRGRRRDYEDRSMTNGMSSSSGGGISILLAPYTREIEMCCLCGCVLFWPLFDTSNWSWRFNILVPAAMMTRFLYKGAIRKDPEDLDVRITSRSSSPSELMYGPLQCAMILVWMGLYRFMTYEAAIVIGSIGIGDSLLAPIVGKVYGRHVYQLTAITGSKTMEGTIVGVFVGTVFGCYFYMSCLGFEVLPLRVILVYGGIAAVAEGTAFKNVDNIAIALALYLSIPRVQDWLLLTTTPTTSTAAMPAELT